MTHYILGFYSTSYHDMLSFFDAPRSYGTKPLLRLRTLGHTSLHVEGGSSNRMWDAVGCICDEDYAAATKVAVKSLENTRGLYPIGC
jgi:hypothetical protein